MRFGEIARAGLALLVASALWLALSATVALWPLATVGLTSIAASLVRGELPRPDTARGAARRYLAASVVWGVVNGAALALLYALDHQAAGGGALPTGAARALRLAALVWLGLQLYALPLLLVQRDGRMLSAWRSALLLAVAAPLHTALLLGAAWFMVSFTRALPVPLLLITPGALALLGCAVAMGRLSAYGYPVK